MTPAELDHLTRKHRKGETYDYGNPEAVDSRVTWCEGCSQRPWPCDTARVLAALDAAREPAGAGLPPGTRLILASENLLDFWGTRTERGERLTVEWGEPSPAGWYEPVFTVHADDRLATPAEPGLDVERLARALYLVQWDGYDALIDLADDAEEWFYPPLILARLISDQWEAALSEPKP